MGDQQKSYKWIQKEVDKLDPYTDYEKIYRLTNSYGLNDFTNNLIYALTFPNFVVTPHGARVIWREDGGKVLNKATGRVEQTENKNATWWYYGPSDPKTQRSIESINKLHEYWDKQYPGDFSKNEDYIYTLAFSAILMHRLLLRMGLSGISEKEKIANHLFWQHMSKHFFAISNGRVPLQGFPENWDKMVEYCEAFENTPREGTEQGHLIASAIYEQFAFRYFPPPLRWLGRSMPIALSLPTTLKTNKIEPVNPVLKAIIVFVVGSLFWFLMNVLPDPEVAFWTEMENMSPEDRKKREKSHHEIDQGYTPYFKERHQQGCAGCPYHAMLKRA